MCFTVGCDHLAGFSEQQDAVGRRHVELEPLRSAADRKEVTHVKAAELFLDVGRQASAPVVNQLSHELEDRSGACWVVVPQLDGTLQDGHVGWISAPAR